MLAAIEKALPALGKNKNSVTIEDLAAVDEFHIGGRIATDHLIDQLNFNDQTKILDVGCGLGGAARYISYKYNLNVSGIDLSREFIEAGKQLCKWLNLEDAVSLYEGSALKLPFQEHVFDGTYMLHVGMNIADKKTLFSEIHRVMKPGKYFAIYDIMQVNPGEITYPVPWASGRSMSKLASPDKYQDDLNVTGFDIIKINNRRNFALDFFKEVSLKKEADKKLAPLGLHILMKDSTDTKIKNMINNIKNEYIAPVEIIARKTKNN